MPRNYRLLFGNYAMRAQTIDAVPNNFITEGLMRKKQQHVDANKI